MSANQSLARIVARLAKFYRRPQPPVTIDPFELILWENVAYLVSDERRAQAFELLRQSVGLKPHEILAAPNDALLKVARLSGVQPERRAARLRELALIVMDEFGGDLSSALKLPQGEEGASEISEHRRALCGKDSPLDPFVSGARSGVKRPAGVAASRIWRREEALLCFISIGAGSDQGSTG